jgi:hypothetical protein
MVREVLTDGTVIDREMNDAELAQSEKDTLMIEQKIQAAAEAEAKRNAALAKLEALGLTPDDLKALRF